MITLNLCAWYLNPVSSDEEEEEEEEQQQQQQKQEQEQEQEQKEDFRAAREKN